MQKTMGFSECYNLFFIRIPLIDIGKMRYCVYVTKVRLIIMET